MRLEMYEYIEVNMIGVVMLVTMLFYSVKKHDQRQSEEQKRFIGMLVLNALILMADNGIYLLRGHGAQSLIALNHLICISYFIMHSWFCFEWLMYVIARLYPRHRPAGAERALHLLPALLSGAMAAASPVTGWVYTITDANVYHRGPFVWVSFLAAIAYWVSGTALTLRELAHPGRKREPGEYRALLAFPLPLLIGNVLQLYFYGMSIVWVMAAISMFILFINMQSDQLSRDELTGLFNRRQTNVQLLWEADQLRYAGDLLLVVMFDVDHFKQINDKYGHLEGDRALTVVARALKDTCRKSDFIGRFGGDEFLLIGHVKHREDAEGLIARIRAAVGAAGAWERLPYSVSLSAGYSLRGQGDASAMDSIISEADSGMYEDKRKRRGSQGEQAEGRSSD